MDVIESLKGLMVEANDMLARPRRCSEDKHERASKAIVRATMFLRTLEELLSGEVDEYTLQTAEDHYQDVDRAIHWLRG